MPTVDFLPIATDPGANVESQADFAGSGHQVDGFTTGIAISTQLNKCWRQPSTFSAVLANLISEVLGVDVLDNGDISGLIHKTSNTMIKAVWAGTSGGSANAQTLTPAVPLDAFHPGISYRYICGFTNTGALTINVSGLGAINLFKKSPSGPVACTGGETAANNVIVISYDGTQWQIDSGQSTAPVAINITQVTVNGNTSAAQNLMSFVIPAGSMNQLQKTRRFTAFGTFTQNIEGERITWDMAVPFNNASTPANITTHNVSPVMGWWMTVTLTTVVAGAGGQIRVGMHMGIGSGYPNDIQGEPSAFSQSFLSSTIDLTSNQTLQFRIKYGTASTANVATQDELIAESLN